MEKNRHFSFRLKDLTISVFIPEIADPEYGMYVWPCAPVLAQFILYNRQEVIGRNVLEIGAGTALPGIMAAKCGANVTLSDSSKYSRSLENCTRSCEANDLHDVTVLEITWGQFSPDLLELTPPDIILGSDCFYNTRDFEDVIMTVSYLLSKNKNAKFWTTYQERSADRSIEMLLNKWNLSCQHIPLELFNASSPDIADSGLPGCHTIHMMVITSR